MIRIVFLAFAFSLPLLAGHKSCEYGQDNSCSESSYCAMIDQTKAECLPLPKEVPIVSLPFAKGQHVTCYKSEVLDEITTHAFHQSRFAIDLYSSYGENADVLSVFTGTAYVNSDCTISSGLNCGAGFGNSIKIVGRNGFMAYYAHLDEVYVISGQQVKGGQLIGREGATGGTGNWPKTSKEGFKHLHFSLHSYKPWAVQYNNLLYPALSSVPFKLKVIQDGRKHVIDVRDFPCHYKGENKKQISAWWN